MTPPLKIVIVDDESPSREFLSYLILSRLPKAKITKIESPIEALDFFQKEDCDILFLDIEMPVMSGWEVLKKIRIMGKNPYTVVVSSPSNAEKAKEFGVEKFITKPLCDEKVNEVLELYLK